MNIEKLKFTEKYKNNKYFYILNMMTWGLGIEHETVLYNAIYNIYGFYIKALYRKTKNERRDPSMLLNMIDDLEKYKVYRRLSSKEITNLILSIKQYIIPKIKDIDVKTKDPDILEYGREIYMQIPKELYNNILELDKSIDIDWNDIGRYVEFITQNPYNRTIGSVVSELNRYEKTFIKIADIKNGNVYIPEEGTSQFVGYKLNKSQIINIYNPNQKKQEKFETSDFISSDYNGSIHYNITLPYSMTESREDFLIKHLYAMQVIQWFEPFFISVYGQPDPFSVGDQGKYVEGSYRMMVNKWSGLATQNLEIDCTDRKSIIKRLSEMDKRIPPKYLRNTIRSLEEDLELRRGYPKPTPPIEGYTTEPNYGPSIGSDFRRGDLDKKEVEADKKYFGFELRTFDHIPTRYQEDILRIIFLICDHSYVISKQNHCLKNPTLNDSWNILVKNIFHNGYNTFISDSQIIDFALNTHLDKIGFSISDVHSNYASDIFTYIVHLLYSHYGHSGHYSKFVSKDKNGVYYSYPPQVVNINQNTYNNFIDFFDINPVNLKPRNILKQINNFILIPYLGKYLSNDEFFQLFKSLKSSHNFTDQEIINYIFFLEKQNKIDLSYNIHIINTY